MTSESKYEIMEQPSATCPLIDALQSKLRETERYTSGYRKCEDPEYLREMLDNIVTSLFHWDTAEEDLEVIRKHVESIRAWGEEWKQLALRLAKDKCDQELP